MFKKICLKKIKKFLNRINNNIELGKLDDIY